ncbi:MAG: hypothetical protein LBS56_04610, partial [Propionibacteriaceae bacterium]|nr:hypothetical protein [Propionibacteriaceae bacterium]
SRSLRDYLLYAADEDIVAVHWSPQILKDMADHLVANRPGRLVQTRTAWVRLGARRRMWRA